LKTYEGGLSGRKIQEYSLPMIYTLRKKYGNSIRIIGGGGIYSIEDYQNM
jgi:dihydroorotate dehydrogenase